MKTNTKKLEVVKDWLRAHRVPVVSAVNSLAIVLGLCLLAAIFTGRKGSVAEAQMSAPPPVKQSKENVKENVEKRVPSPEKTRRAAVATGASGRVIARSSMKPSQAHAPGRELRPVQVRRRSAPAVNPVVHQPPPTQPAPGEPFDRTDLPGDDDEPDEPDEPQ